MPLSLTLGTSYPINLDRREYSGAKDEANLGSQLINIGVKVTDDFELILNRSFYIFTRSAGGEPFYLTTHTLGIGYFF